MNGSRRKIFGLTCANKYNGPVKEKKEKIRKKKEAKTDIVWVGQNPPKLEFGWVGVPASFQKSRKKLPPTLASSLIENAALA